MTQPVARQEDKPARVLSRRILIIALLVIGIAALAVSALRLVSRQETAVSPEQNVQQGLALNKQQQYDAAIDEFTQAITARPDMVDACLYRGIALFEAGRPNDSMQTVASCRFNNGYLKRTGVQSKYPESLHSCLRSSVRRSLTVT